MPAKSYQEVLTFWFGEKSSPDYLRQRPFWYGTTAADDAHVRDDLGPLYEDAKRGLVDQWQELGQGEGSLALILLLDQVPRNIFRDTPQAYATDAQALKVARDVIARGWDKNMASIQRRYMYAPFNHSENLQDQEESVRLFTELGDPEHLQYAKDFHDQIKKNGRFVHRDAILGR